MYAVWERDWKPLLVVLPLSLVRPILLIYESAHYVPFQGGPPFGCFEFSFVSDADLSQMGFRTPLATLLLRDGTAYFLISLIVEIVTIVSNSMGEDNTVWLVWPYFEQVLTVICFSRFMLDLRGVYFAGCDGREGDTTLHLSDVNFEGITSTIIGNLGTTTFSTQIQIPTPEHTHEDKLSPSGPVHSLEQRYAWEWRDEEVELSDNPFRTGFQSPEKPPVFVVSETGEAEMADGMEIQEIQIANISSV
ncbi:hypothetical protein VTO73DRAFT_12772 [Trametes versicolor]